MPEVCALNCGKRMAGARLTYEANGSEHCDDDSVEFGGETLEATSLYDREQVVIDECGAGHSIGEQRGQFSCNRPARS